MVRYSQVHWLIVRQSDRWNAVVALDVVTEVYIVLLPTVLVCRLQMRVAAKLWVAAAFFTRAT